VFPTFVAAPLLDETTWEDQHKTELPLLEARSREQHLVPQAATKDSNPTRIRFTTLATHTTITTLDH
jgi:hypothetical protein